MSESAHPKLARADHDILDLIRRRWSPRAFDPDRAVARDDLLKLFEAARWAPSSFNEQPWRFVVCERERHPEAFAALHATLTGRNPDWAVAVPVLVLVAVRRTLSQGGIENAHAWYDTGQAVSLLTLQATALGLAVRQMQGFDVAQAGRACRIAAPFEPAVVMAIGYAGDPGSLAHEPHRRAELAPRSRRPIAEFVYEASWGQPFPTTV